LYGIGYCETATFNLHIVFTAYSQSQHIILYFGKKQSLNLLYSSQKVMRFTSRHNY